MPQDIHAPNVPLIELAADNRRLRAWLEEIAHCQGDNSLAETLARRIRFIARRALAGDPHG